MAYIKPQDLTPDQMLKVRDTSRQALAKAVKILGSKTKVAEAIDVSPEILHSWMAKSNCGISPRYVIPLEEATKGKVTRYELRSDIYIIDE